MLKVHLTKTSLKFLENRPPKHARQLAKKIFELRENPHPQDSKKLSGKASGYLRADAGEYRIIYSVDNKETLLIEAVGKRNDHEVYRKFIKKIR